MLDGGADPRYGPPLCAWPARRHRADLRALRLALDAAEVYERLGSPEGELALANVWSTWPWPQVQRGLQGVQRGQGLGEAGRHPACAHAFAQRPHAA